MIMSVKAKRKWQSFRSLASLLQQYVRNPINSLGDHSEPAIGVNYDEQGQIESVEVVGFSNAALRNLRPLIPFDPLFKKVLEVHSYNSANSEEAPAPVRGAYFIEGRRLVFRPRSSLRSGEKFRAVAHLDAVTGESFEFENVQLERHFNATPVLQDAPQV